MLWEPQLVNTHRHTQHHPWETEPQHKHFLLHQPPYKRQFGVGWFQLLAINLGYNLSDQLPTAPSGGTQSLITITSMKCVCAPKRFCACIFVKILSAHFRASSPNLNFNIFCCEAEFSGIYSHLHVINILHQMPLICFHIAFSWSQTFINVTTMF